ncbi:hypothetical protein [Plantactinospora sp. GCM10030261]|uniref:hypothetical protein n=1 Tax=Plantactinospora sp. GCM10030261 TaxID=3273420 RepID=UPI0036210E7D
MLRRAVPPLLAAIVVVFGVAALMVSPAVGAPQGRVDYVVMAGVPGLRWDDVSPEQTPTLWRLAGQGSIGSLSVRSGHNPTCPVDGWLTLGAGNYAGWPGERGTTGCPTSPVTVARPDRIGANLPDQRGTVLHNKDRLPWGAVPGALPESVRCTVAIGPGAAVAAARPFGRVDRYEPNLPEDAAGLLSSCVLSMVDLGTVAGEDPAERAAAARRADAALARLLAARPDNSLVLVAGVSDTDQTSRLHVAVADGPGWERGWLTSASTGRDGYLQLIDLAPTALRALDRPLPEQLFRGQPATVVQDRPADLSAAIAGPADADEEAGAQRRVASGFFALLAGCQFLLAIAVVPLLRRARRHAGPGGPTPAPRRVVEAVEVLLVAAALAIPAALVADAVPWWRTGHPGWAFAATTLVVLTVATAGVRFARGYRRTLGPLGAVVIVAAIIVGTDVLTGARLQLNGVTGYSALEGGRYAGLGTVGFGVFTAAILLSGGWLAQRIRREWRPAVLICVGGLGVVLVGSPYLGSDPVGAVALTAGVSIAAAISTGGWLTLGRLAWATIAGLVVTVGFAVIDMRRPAGERGGLGRFLDALGDGTGGMTVHRSGAASVDALTGSPLTVLALIGAVLVWFALLQPWGGLKRLFGIYPAVRAAMLGIPVAALLAGLLGGSALNVAGAAAALTVPLAALSALRVLDHATDRTRPPEPRTADSGSAGASADRADESAGSPVDGADPVAGSGVDGADPAADEPRADVDESPAEGAGSPAVPASAVPASADPAGRSRPPR